MAGEERVELSVLTFRGSYVAITPLANDGMCGRSRTYRIALRESRFTNLLRTRQVGYQGVEPCAFCSQSRRLTPGLVSVVACLSRLSSLYFAAFLRAPRGDRTLNAGVRARKFSS